MFQLSQFNLKFAFARPRPLRKDIENQLSPVENLALEGFFEVAALRGRKFVVENDGINVVLSAPFAEFSCLARAYIGPRNRRFELLRSLANHRCPRRCGKFSKFLQRIFHIPPRPGFQFNADQKYPFGSFCGYLD